MLCETMKLAILSRRYAYFEWNTETGASDTDVLSLYESSLLDDGEIFYKCKKNAGRKNLQGIDAVIGADPTIPVFIFVKGFLRAGKTIDTTHVSAVIDLPVKTSGNLDSLVQGLVVL